ncbi:MAG: DUF188 domain-containing protein [Spirochaetaceae bacterium]|jgi:uncharacterized protein YaiI (UPF0178 family)|nr:DUF188 domain-containing protein [Spirochaetaceae bacterium]
MKILVDADSCPKAARHLILRSVARTALTAIFVANRPIPQITGPGVVMEVCPAGDGAADDRIMELARPGDLAVTRDIPLASRLVEAAIQVIDDRGHVYTKENIREKLSIRNFTVRLADNGLAPERTAAYGKRECKKFADSLDRLLGTLIREARKNSALPGY